MIHFERGKDPRGTMGIGLAAQIKKSVEKILENPSWIFIPGENKDEWEEQISKEVGVEVKTEVLHDDGGIYKLRVKCEKANYEEDFEIGGALKFPTMTKVSARTIGQDLVPVQPMPFPRGIINYLDYQYGKNTVSKRKGHKGKSKHRKNR